MEGGEGGAHEGVSMPVFFVYQGRGITLCVYSYLVLDVSCVMFVMCGFTFVSRCVPLSFPASTIRTPTPTPSKAAGEEYVILQSSTAG